MKEKTQIIVLALCIVITLTLTISVYYRGHDNSCEKCIVDFITTNQFGSELEEPIVTKMNIVDIYEGYLQNECIIKWNRNQGYYE